jgi:hypothetical protein
MAGGVCALREPPRQAEEDLDLAEIGVQLRGLRTASQKRRYRGAPGSNITQAKARDESFDDGGGI